MEKKKVEVAKIALTGAAIILAFAAVLASEYMYGDISIGLAVALGICLISVIFDAARLGGWREKIWKWPTEPDKCSNCGGTEFESVPVPKQMLWWGCDPWHNCRFNGIGGGDLSFPFPLPRRCKGCGEINY